MSGGQNNGPRIPASSGNGILKAKLGTAGTVERPKSNHGTDSFKTNELHYVDMPPPRDGNTELKYWTVDKISSVVTIGLCILGIIFFFLRLNSDVETVKSDVKEIKDSVGKLDGKIVNQTSSTDRLDSSVQRVENEIRRTQDYIRDKKK